MRHFILAIAAAATLLLVSSGEAKAQYARYSAHRPVAQQVYHSSSYSSPQYSVHRSRPAYRGSNYSSHGYYAPRQTYYSGRQNDYSGSYRSGCN